MQSPHDLGLPAKFDRWRSCQPQGINAITQSPKRHTVISSPTGSGKSLMVVGAALASNKRVCITTMTRGLQDQYLDDFSEIGMVDLRGLGNYECALKPDYTCEDGKAARCPYWGSVQCPYSQAEMKVASSRLAVVNLPKWLARRTQNSCLDNFDMLILDEAHCLPEALASAMQVVLHYKEIEETLKVPFPTGDESKEFWNWKVWAKNARAICEGEVMDARRRIECVDPKSSWLKHFNHMKRLLEDISTIALANPKDWVCEQVRDGWQFDPIRPARYAEGKLFHKIPRVVYTSATVRPKTMYMLGVAQDRFDFHEFPSDFDSSRCPIYHIPTMRMEHRQADYTSLYTRIDQIMARRQDRKGLIQTVSWEQGGASTKAIYESCRFSRYMLTNERGMSASDYIEGFKASPPPYVMISPSIGMGYDFAGSAAEYQIIVKIPFPDGRSLIVKARQEDDKDYGPYNAMQNLVQRVGRIMRSKSDRGESFILDDHIEWFRPRYGHFAPKSFHQFFRQVQTIPQPPPRLEGSK